jgi:FkbM family methyltransferase
MEIFCRRDYGDGGGEIVVDLGANIGVASLFFLTRRRDARVYCYEPDPRNSERLRGNLERFADRYELAEAAVAVESGRVKFLQEHTGRYSGIAAISNRAGSEIEVESVAIADVIERVLVREGRIDVLKVDTEGNEAELVRAIPPSQSARIREIYFETNAPDGRTAHFGH